MNKYFYGNVLTHIKGTSIYGTSLPKFSQSDIIYETTTPIIIALSYLMRTKNIDKIVSFQACGNMTRPNNHISCLGDPTFAPGTDKYNLANIEEIAWKCLKKLDTTKNNNDNVKYKEYLIQDMTEGTLDSWIIINTFDLDIPTAVHCYAGYGRTGAALLLFALKHLSINTSLNLSINFFGYGNSRNFYNFLKDIANQYFESGTYSYKKYIINELFSIRSPYHYSLFLKRINYIIKMLWLYHKALYHNLSDKTLGNDPPNRIILYEHNTSNYTNDVDTLFKPTIYNPNNYENIIKDLGFFIKQHTQHPLPNISNISNTSETSNSSVYNNNNNVSSSTPLNDHSTNNNSQPPTNSYGNFVSDYSSSTNFEDNSNEGNQSGNEGNQSSQTRQSGGNVNDYKSNDMLISEITSPDTNNLNNKDHNLNNKQQNLTSIYTQNKEKNYELYENIKHIHKQIDNIVKTLKINKPVECPSDISLEMLQTVMDIDNHPNGDVYLYKENKEALWYAYYNVVYEK